MLTDPDLEAYCDHLGFAGRTRELIRQIRSSPPSRRVRSAACNVSGRYPSKKMGRTIQFESHTVALPAIHLMEHNPDVLEFYDQPPPIWLDYLAHSGRRVVVSHTPDFFVLRSDGAGWEEWKPEEALGKLSARTPRRYARSETGDWQCPPADAVAVSYGLSYRIHSSAEIDWTYWRNLTFLEDYLRTEAAAIPIDMVETITSLVSAHPGLTLETLLRAVGTTHADSVYALLVQHVIYVDLHATLLTQPSDVRVFANEEMAKALTIVSTPPATRACDRVGTVSLAVGTTVTWDGRPWTVLQVGATQTVLLSQDGVSAPLSHEAFQDLVACDLITGLPPRAETQAVVERLRQASPRDLAIANSRYTLIAPYLNGRVIAPDHPQRRTIFRFRALWHKAQVSCGWSYLGLLPRPHPGNRRPKLPEATLALIDEFIDQRYETVKQRRALEVYGEYLIACGHRALPPCSYRTFMRRIRLRDRHRQTVKREGRRAAYAVAPFYWFLTPETPRHGDLPFEIGHIDHTELPIELVDSHTGVNLGCPWATFLTDAFSRRILADFLTFDPPSYRSCMMVLRDCIRRWGRLPRTLVVDGGKEFASVYFEALLAAVEVTLKVRPPAKPRFGSVIERTFGTTATQFVYNLAGNRQFRGLPRLVTRAIDPARLAVWTLPEFSRKLHEYAFDVYDTLPHATLGQSPREAFAMGVAMAGARAHLLIPYDDTVRMLTLPTTPRGLAKVVPPHGVKIRYVYYWANDFRDPAIERTMVPVRYDPFDAGTAYAYVKGRWVTCSAEHYTELRGRSERELALAAEELRQRHRQHGRYEDITARRLAEFLTSCEGQELLLAQRRRDAEVRATLALAGDRDMVDPPNGDANHQEVVGDQQPPPRMPSAQLRPYGEYR